MHGPRKGDGQGSISTCGDELVAAMMKLRAVVMSTCGEWMMHWYAVSVT